MAMHHVRRGAGKPVLLVHGLGGSGQSWETIIDGLATEREVIAVTSRVSAGPHRCGGGLDRDAHRRGGLLHRPAGVASVDTVGSSMGARMVLELARRGVGGTAVALDPGGFWSDGELRFFGLSLRASIKLLRALRSALPALMGNPVTRTLLLAQFSARPWALPPDVPLRELQRSWNRPPSTTRWTLSSTVRASRGRPPDPSPGGS